MCGVDRFDQNVAQYRIAYRGKKWWSSIFTWLIDACVQNAWQLHRKVQPTMTQLEFRRQLAVYYCKHYGTKAKSSGPMPAHRYAQQPGRVEHSLRYDQTGHFVVPSNVGIVRVNVAKLADEQHVENATSDFVSSVLPATIQNHKWFDFKICICHFL